MRSRPYYRKRSLRMLPIVAFENQGGLEMMAPKPS
jgi:hypothetical protein